MTTSSSATLVLKAPGAMDRDRVREMVIATGVFRSSEVEIALEVFDGAVHAPGVDYRGLGAYDGDDLIGLTLWGHTPGTDATWDLYWIVVDPRLHRHAIGRSLMAATEREISERGGRLIVVETSSREDYEPTHRFYDALGYDRAAFIPDYYTDGDGLIVLTKQLNPSPSSDG